MNKLPKVFQIVTALKISDQSQQNLDLQLTYKTLLLRLFFIDVMQSHCSENSFKINMKTTAMSPSVTKLQVISHQHCLFIPSEYIRVYGAQTLRKILNFQLIFWCGNFAERYSFCRLPDNLPETLRKLCLSTKLPHQKIR